MPKAPPLKPVLIVGLSIAAFLGVMNFAILPEGKKNTITTNTSSGTSQANSSDSNVNDAVLENTNASEDIVADAQDNANENTNVANDDGWRTYSNTEFGFSLTFPDTWIGYGVTQNGNSLCYTAPPAQGRQNFCILQMTIYTNAEWAALGDKKPDIFRETADRKFVAEYDAANCVQLDQGQCDLAQEVPAILATFAIN